MRERRKAIWFILALACLSFFTLADDVAKIPVEGGDIEGALARIMKEAHVAPNNHEDHDHDDLGEAMDAPAMEAPAAASIPPRLPRASLAPKKKSSVVTRGFWDMPRWARSDEVAMLEENGTPHKTQHKKPHHEKLFSPDRKLPSVYIAGIDKPPAAASRHPVLKKWETQTEQALLDDAENRVEQQKQAQKNKTAQKKPEQKARKTSKKHKRGKARGAQQKTQAKESPNPAKESQEPLSPD